MNNEKKFIKLTPFKMQVLQSFPFIDEDFDAITNYELLCKVVEYLNITVSNVDLLNEKVEEFQNYFDNLDVQEEINNKLDEMAESGELTDIIAQYLGLAGVISFNTVNDMKNATNLVDGSTAHTLGYYSLNDGGSAYYKIRTITNEDVVDEMLIISLNNNTLIAELIKSSTIDVRQLGAKSEISFDNKNYIQKAIDNFKTIIISENYYTSNAITLNSDIDICGNGKIYTDSPYIFSGNNISNVTIKDIELESTVDTTDTSNMSETTPDTRGYTTLSSIIELRNSDNITIRNCIIHGSFTGIFAILCNNVVVDNNECYESSSKVVCLSQSKYKLINNYIHDVKINEDDYYPCYLFQSTDDELVEHQEQSIVSNNRFENNANWDAIMMHKYNKISILDNTMLNVRSGIDLTIAETEATTGNIIISNNYIEGTDTNRWGDNNALNHGIIIIGDANQSSLVISDNIIKNFGKFKSANGGCGVIIRDSSKVIFSNNIIEMDTTVNSVKAGLYLRGTINQLNVTNNIINSKAILPILLFNLQSDLCIIKNNILKTTNPANCAIDTLNVINLTKAEIDNITDVNYSLQVRNGDKLNGISYTATNLFAVFTKLIKSQASIESFTIPANSVIQKFISKNDINYDGTFNNHEIYTVTPIGNIDRNVILTAQYGDSGNIRLEFINTSSSDVTINTTSYNVVIQH